MKLQQHKIIALLLHFLFSDRLDVMRQNESKLNSWISKCLCVRDLKFSTKKKSNQRVFIQKQNKTILSNSRRNLSFILNPLTWMLDECTSHKKINTFWIIEALLVTCEKKKIYLQFNLYDLIQIYDNCIYSAIDEYTFRK